MRVLVIKFKERKGILDDCNPSYIEYIPMDNIEFVRVRYDEGEFTEIYIFKKGEAIPDSHNGEDIESVKVKTLKKIV